MPANGYDVYTWVVPFPLPLPFFHHELDELTLCISSVNNKVSSRGQLNVTGSSNKSGTEIIAWPIENTDNTKWYFESH